MRRARGAQAPRPVLTKVITGTARALHVRRPWRKRPPRQRTGRPPGGPAQGAPQGPTRWPHCSEWRAGTVAAQLPPQSALGGPMWRHAQEEREQKGPQEATNGAARKAQAERYSSSHQATPQRCTSGATTVDETCPCTKEPNDSRGIPHGKALSRAAAKAVPFQYQRL